MTTATAYRESVSIPIAGLEEAHIRIGFGGGELAIHPAQPGTLVDGLFDGGIKERSYGPGHIELSPGSPGLPLMTWEPVRWDVGLTTEIPIDLRIDTGANRSEIDLREFRLRELELHTGASDTTVRLPTRGASRVRVECGFASVVLVVPIVVAARIHGSVGVGSLSIDEARFPRLNEAWESPDYDVATNRVDITVSGGFGSVRVI